MITAKKHLEVSVPPGSAVLEGLVAHTKFAFSSPTRTVITTGPVIAADQRDPRLLCGALRELERGGGTDPCLFACYPFSATDSLRTAPAQICLAPHTSVGSAMPWFKECRDTAGHEATVVHPRRGRRLEGEPHVSWRVDRATERVSRDGYLRAVGEGLRRIEAGLVSKVVLARILDLMPEDGIGCVPFRLNPQSAAHIVRSVLLRQPARYGFAVNLPGSTPAGVSERWMFGVSPELLVRKRGVIVESFPLAGSVPKSCDVTVDANRASALLRSPKDLREHAFVTQSIADVLSPFCKELSVPEHPELVSTSTLWHLGTPIRGTLRDAAQSSLELALALHPTPAVCGTPAAAAHQTIADLETVPRDYFAGTVGWCDSRGDGEWAVTIRCGELSPTRLRLYAGAGIVAGSDPEHELLETDAKLRTLLSALHITPAGALD